jgi:two-component system, OmpR family, sensor histidine kinase KdpD
MISVKWLAAPMLVAMAAVLGRLLDANVEARLMLVAVVAAALLGRGPGLMAALLGFLALTFLPSPPGLDQLTRREELIDSATFLVIALVIGSLVIRIRESRQRAELGEREARLRVEITDQLLRGRPIQNVADGAAESIRDAFGVVSCTLDVVGLTGASTVPDVPRRSSAWVQRLRRRDVPATPSVSVRANDVTITVVPRPNRILSAAGEEVLVALATALGNAFGRVELERAASEAKVDAEVNRARAAFFAAAGHNLRTPLASVDASVSALLESRDALDTDQEDILLETIAGETSRLGRMVTKVLSQSQIHGTDLVPEREPIDLEGMVQVAVGRLGPLGADQRYELDIPPDTPALDLDVTMLEQILLNLLENAVRFSPEGSVISILARGVGDDVELRIVDHGPGVPDGEHELIFEEFHRAGTRTEGAGTGLGLSIVRALVDAHDGSVACEDTPGGGATFVVRFPTSDSREPSRSIP